MSRYVALRLRKLPVVHWHFESGPTVLPDRGQVLTRTQQGSEVATILRVLPEGKTADIPPEPFIKEIIRPLGPEDRDALKEICAREKEAFKKTRDLITLHKLEMKLLKSEYLFDYARLILYYKAENKVDFRELLKSLASAFKTRIELRQIGVRDETKLLGGIGCCGKTVCCAEFMSTFHPVSTKMAKDQNLSMNPAKLSGICCRLLCCIAHEHEYYASFHGKYPKIGADILHLQERAKVLDLNYITQKVLLGFPDRRKDTVLLPSIKGRKDPDTGRNLWWVQDAGGVEPDLSILLQPPPAPPARGNQGRGGAPQPAAEGQSRPPRSDSRSKKEEPGAKEPQPVEVDPPPEEETAPPVETPKDPVS